MGLRLFCHRLKINVSANCRGKSYFHLVNLSNKCLDLASASDSGSDDPARFVLKRTSSEFNFKRYFKSDTQSSANKHVRKPVSDTTLHSQTTMMSAFTDDVQELHLPTLDSKQDFKSSPEFQDIVNTCSTCLLDGGVIAVPTDTIYGIAGLSQKIHAVNRIYEIKHRNYHNPVAISVGDVDDIYRWSKVTVPRDLLTDLLPGPVTVVFERNPELNPHLNPHTTKVGIRIPGNAFMQELARKCDSPIALTSANISGGRSCLKIEEFPHLWPLLDVVVNGGVLNDTEESRLGSTVVDLSTPGSFRIIRNGSAYLATSKVLQDKYNLKNASVPPNSQR